MNNQLQENIIIKPEYELNFTNQNIIDFFQYLILNERSKNTVDTYKNAIKVYIERYGNILSKMRMIDFKKFLLSENYNVKTINIKLQALNSFIRYLFEAYEENQILKCIIKNIKIQKRTSVDNVITTQEFNTLLEYVKTSKDIKDNLKWYLIIKTLGYTGVRVSELIKLNINDLQKGDIFIIHSKGDKVRNVIVPKNLKKELLDFAKERNIKGTIFKNYQEKEFTTRGIAHFIYELGKKADVPVEHCHPHSFRHMYAINLLKATNNNLSFVSDMLGHANIETTRVYLMMSLDSQKELINNKVNW